jgi:protease II
MRRAPLALLLAAAARRRGLATTSAAPAAAAAAIALPPPPRYPRRRDSNNNDDPYAWMRTADPHGRELAPHLEQEARLFRAAGLGQGPGARALRRAIEEQAAAAVGGAAAASAPEPSGPYEYWQRHADEEDHDQEWALMRRPRGSSSGEAVAVLSAGVVARDAALALRRLWPRSSSSFFSSRPRLPNPEDVFGPGFEHTPPDVRLSRDHALLAYLLPYAPSAAAALGGSGGDTTHPLPPPEGAALLVVRPASDINSPPLTIVRVATGAEFSPWFTEGDDARIYFVEPDAETGRPRRVRGRRVAMGAGAQDDDHSPTTLYDEADPRFFVALTRTKDWRALVVNAHSKVSSEVRLLLQPPPPSPPAPPSLTMMLVAPRRPGVEYFVEHRRGEVLVLTNAPELFLGGGGGCSSSSGLSSGAAVVGAGAAGAAAAAAPGGRDYALLSAPLVRSDKTDESSSWRLGPFTELESEPTGRCCVSAAVAAAENGDDDESADARAAIAATTDMDVFDAGIVLQQRDAMGRPALSVVGAAAEAASSSFSPAAEPPPRRRLRRARLPPWALAVEPAANQDPSSRAFRFDLSSPARPPRPYELDLITGDVRSLIAARQEGASSLPPLVCRRLIARCLPGDDDKEENEGVPVTVLYRKDLDHPPPITLLEAYGAYGRPLEASWRADRAALALALGWRVALAHARGGGELGRRWHRAGRGSRKARSARDVVAVARFLVREGLAQEGRIALLAASAGAVAGAGAVLSAPALFGAAVLEVPFVDALAEMVGGSGDEADDVSSSAGSTAAAALDLLAQHERDEWGDDDDEDEEEQGAVAGATGGGGGSSGASSSSPSFRALERGACPYQALLRMSSKANPADLPPLLLTAAADDARVRPQGVARFAALYRDVAGPATPVLLRLAAEGGHFGAGTAAGFSGEVAELYEFVRRAVDGGGGGGGGRGGRGER